MENERYRILILPQEHVLDVQGRAVEKTLGRLDFPKSEVRIGRLVEVTLPKNSTSAEVVKKMTEEVFFNPLIEKYEIAKVSG